MLPIRRLSAIKCIALCLLLSGGLPTCGELVLANFSTASPMKIMCVGDSITDDCSISGAWRAPLQSLLQSNGVTFTNVGRLQSPALAGFTQRRHEGYCGSVIGPPGVFAVYNYSTMDAYLHRIVGDALAITNIRPDLMLILIGANDIGRGRNPFTVATNDMATLLNIIFSNAPSVHVMLAKATTLQNAGLGYAGYAVSITTYNSALQRLVNQRRASGQNVFLADMFSAVDYGTMFQSDHLHPNSSGLRAIAGEWAARMETILIRTNQQFASVLINGGANWKYSATGQPVEANWAQPEFDDSGWSNGAGRFGYGNVANTTTVSYGPMATNKYITTYFRRPFVVPWNAVITNLNFRLARADGAAVWLNGQEMFRTNLPAGPLSHTNLALTVMTGYTAHVYYPTNFASAPLPAGTNWLAVEVHLSAVTNTTMGFDLELIGSGYRLPTPSLAISRLETNITLSWPAADGNGFTLYANTNLSATSSWVQSTASVQTNGSQVVVTQSPDAALRFFRLQRP